MTRNTSVSNDADPRLISGKLEPPESLVKLAERPQLIERLDRCRDNRVTLISAPAGYGKTTLLSRWREADASRPVAWLSLDRLDSDLERFVRYVVAALSRVVGHAFPQTVALLNARTLPPSEALAESLVLEAEASKQRTTLVLDDYGSIRAQAVHDFVVALVSRLPQTLRLVIASRIDPPLPLSLWRTRHWLHELRLADLRCSHEEATAVLASAKQLSLSGESVELLQRRTEGWITGLRLALLSLDGSPDPEERVRAFSASERLVTDYLMEEILDRQPPEVREFLAMTSALERFSPELCAALWDRDGRASVGQSRALLDRLYHENLFVVTLGPTRSWYRYHHLFRQLLLERFGELTIAVSKGDIRRRAGRWFDAHGWTEDALGCFLAADDLDAAEDLVGSHLYDVMCKDPSRRTLARWLGMFPRGAERHRLPLLVAAGHIKVLHSDYEGLAQLVGTIDALGSGAPGGRAQRWQRRFEHDLACFRAVTSFWSGDLEGAREHASRFAGHEADLPDHLWTMSIAYYGTSLALTGRRAEYLRFVEGGISAWGTTAGVRQLPYRVLKTAVHWYRGELADCRSAAAGLTADGGLSIPKLFEAMGYYYLGAVAYERNELDVAERHFLAAASRRFETAAFFDHATVAGLAHIELARGRLDAAEEHARMARSIAVKTGSSMLIQGSEALETRIAMAAGRSPDIASEPPPAGDVLLLSILQPCQCWAWARIRNPSIEARAVALELLDAAGQIAEARGVARRCVQISALRALALDALNRREEAVAALAQAVRQGAPLGLVRSFVDLGAELHSLLLVLTERAPDDPDVATLLDAFGAPSADALQPIAQAQVSPAPAAGAGDAQLRSAAARAGGPAFEALTNRELDVLEGLQQRLSNKEIARRLGISDATVKTHTLGVYGKLGVQGRREAVAAAIERGILPG